MLLCASVYLHSIYFLLFYVSRLPQNIMLEYHHFSPTHETLCEDE